MPVYEFHCNKCNTRFEALCRMGDTNGVTCPVCSATDVTKRLSTFFSSRSSSGATLSASKCSGCSGGSCSTCG